MRRLLFLLLLSVPVFATPPQWVEVRSPHFSVFSDGGEKRGRDVALRFEQMRAVFGTLIIKDRVNIPIPLQIIAFRNSKELRAHGMLFNGKPVEVAGFFQAGEDRQFIALDLSQEENWRTVFHEYAHLLLNGNFPAVPLWFDEGFAEYYSTIKFTGKEVRIGDPPPGTVELLLSGRIPMEQLFSVGHHDKTYNESGPQRSLFYAQSWLLVHYLFDLKKLKELQQYLTLSKSEVPVADAMQRAFGMNSKQFDKALNEYFHSTKAVFYQAPTPAGMDQLQFTTRPLSDVDVQVVLADLHLHSVHRGEQAVGEFEAILKADPDNVEAHRGLGYAYLRKGMFEPAAAEFRAAAEHSNDPRVYYYAALLRFRQGGNVLDGLDEIKQQLQRAIELSPEFADAYSMLGWAQSVSGNHEAAIQYLQRAVQLSPRNELYQVNLAQSLLAAGRLSEAEPMLEQLAKSEEPQVASMASQVLAGVQRVREAEAAFKARERMHPEEVTAPQWQGTVKDTSVTEPAPVPTKPRPIQFLKGMLLAVDCSAAPGAVLTVTSGKNTWKLRTSDRLKLVLIAADEFSCEWRNRKISANYVVTGTSEGDLVSLEIQ